MKKFLYISVAALLFANACTREQFQNGDAQAVAVSLQLEVAPFGTDGQILTKAEFEDPVAANIHYDYEKNISSLKLFLFDASGAFVDLDSDGKLDFDPSQATRIGIGAVTPLHVEDMGADGYRVDFRVENPYEALAVVAIANMPAAVDASAWATMADVDSDVYMEYTASQDTYHSNGIPMHGFQIFGSQVGNSSPQESSKLKYYKGISTKLPGTLSMQYALVRMQLRYLPAAGQLPASQVEILSAKLTGYKSKFRLFPKEWLTGTLVTPFDEMVDGGDFVNGDISFRKVSYEVSATETADAWVAYVPEMSAKVLADKMAADPTFKEPSLTAVMKKYEVDEHNVRTGEWSQFTYSTDGVKMETSSASVVTYVNPGWTAWLQMRTLYNRKDKAGNDVPVGTLFNLVRHYSYEWKATGIDK